MAFRSCEERSSTAIKGTGSIFRHQHALVVRDFYKVNIGVVGLGTIPPRPSRLTEEELKELLL
jgi:hypothetical protein